MSASGHADLVIRRRALSAATTSALLAGALVSVAGCDQNSGCVHTALSLTPTRVSAPDAPLRLPAKLSSDGSPLADFRLAFSIVLAGPTQMVGRSGRTGRLMGYAMTDAAGRATYTVPDGVDGVVLPREHAVGYSVSLTTANPIGGKQYCDVHQEAPLTT
jgi:hypothetical protein